MPTICFATLGCKVNQVESAFLHERFTAAGYTVVPWPGPADVCVVNTCTVTATADRQSRQMTRRARRHNPEAFVVVTGCAPLGGEADAGTFADADLVTGNVEKADLPRLVATLTTGRVTRSPDEEAITAADGHGAAERTRAFVKVQDGCPAACAYCIVPRVRGPHRSVAPERVLRAARDLAAVGYREIVLTGIHLGLYGRELEPATNLSALCAAILNETDVLRLRLSSVEPGEVDEALIDLMSAEPRLCAHLHVPLQSGSDRVLAAMKRPYRVAEYTDLVARLRARVPGITIGADVIVGFPTETEDDFATTLATLAALRLPHLHVFPYADRPGTPAAAMTPKVPAAEIRRRAALVRERAAADRFAHWQEQVGAELATLFQERVGDRLRGLSRNYLPVFAAGEDKLLGREAAVRIERADEGGLSGRVTGD